MSKALFLERLLGSAVFFVRLMKRRVPFRKRLKYNKRYNGAIAVLANGPSLKSVLPILENSKDFDNVEFSVHNFFGFEDVFFRIRPRFYALADPMFIKKNHRYEEVVRLFDILQNKVDWDLTLYIPFDTKDFILYSKLTNSNIKIVHVETLEANCWEKLKIWLYSKGFACPYIGSVVQLNIFAAINEGFDEIHLYGVDHTMICNLALNEEYQLCNKYEHFSDSQPPTMQPIIRYDGIVYPVSEFLMFNGKLFEAHEQLKKYSECHQSKIVNYTPKSMIDCYERGNFLH